jgi:hypothetical protein
LWILLYALYRAPLKLEIRKSLSCWIAKYRVSIVYSKIVLSEFNVVNNISGAFGVFRKSVLNILSGWEVVLPKI